MDNLISPLETSLVTQVLVAKHGTWDIALGSSQTLRTTSMSMDLPTAGTTPKMRHSGLTTMTSPAAILTSAIVLRSWLIQILEA